MCIDDDDKICMYCKYRDFTHEMKLPVRRPWGWSEEVCAPCLLQASDCECGPGTHMYAEDGHCRYHDDAFEPSESYWVEIGNREAWLESDQIDKRELEKWLAYA